MKKLLALCALVLGGTPLFADEMAGRNPSSFMQTLVMIGIAIIFFYFILWRPERKRRKQLEETRGAMKKGDHVTAMGIVGTIDRIKDNTVIVKMVDGAKVEFLKAAISEVKPQNEASQSEES